MPARTSASNPIQMLHILSKASQAVFRSSGSLKAQKLWTTCHDQAPNVNIGSPQQLFLSLDA